MTLSVSNVRDMIANDQEELVEKYIDMLVTQALSALKYMLLQ